MPIGPIAAHLTAEHRQLDALLDASQRTTHIDAGPYAEFRDGLLRHIGIEEKILLPAAQSARGGVALAIASRLRLDHGAIAALLVPTPTFAVVATLRHVLARHNAIEEGLDGLYAECDRLFGASAVEIVERLRAYPPPRSSPHNDAPGVLPALERALQRAGYRLLDRSSIAATGGPAE